jgi:hypothetical protein
MHKKCLVHEIRGTPLTGLSDFRINIPTSPRPFVKLIISLNYNKMMISKIYQISSLMRWDSHDDLNGRRTCDGNIAS